jgi:transketolase N-terminal domain/subunit
MALKIKNGKKYQANIILNWAESFAGNATIKSKLEAVGFKDVKVSGVDYNRVAEGIWVGDDIDDATELLPEQIREVKEIET